METLQPAVAHFENVKAIAEATKDPNTGKPTVPQIQAGLLTNVFRKFESLYGTCQNQYDNMGQDLPFPKKTRRGSNCHAWEVVKKDMEALGYTFAPWAMLWFFSSKATSEVESGTRL